MKNKTTTLSMIFFLIVISLSMQACVFDANTIRGDKNVVSVEMDLDHFDGIRVSGMYKVYLEEGNSPFIRIETDKNIHEYVEVDVKNRILNLGMKSHNSYSPTRMDVYITTNSLSEIKLSGATSISSKHSLSSDNLEITLSGASDMNLKVMVHNLKTSISGAGNVNISGDAQTHSIKISGVASMNCLELATHKTNVSISGAGSARVNATEKLQASVSGVGSIQYTGSPKTTNFSTSGAGSIKPI